MTARGLEAEVERLRADNRRLKAENELLRHELGQDCPCAYCATLRASVEGDQP